MSYSLRYGACRFDSRPAAKKKKLILLATVLLTAVIAFQVFFPTQMARFRKHALPFLEPNVRQAFGEMTASIEAGESLGDAAAVFCREIIGDAVG